MTVRSIRVSSTIADPDVLRAHLAEITKNVRDKIAMQALRGIVLRTPVDTGRARSNWHVSTEGPDVSIGPALFPGAGGSTGSANAEAVILAGSETIGAAPPFGFIYIANGLPYINRLEHGYSKQSPGGMVRVTLDQIQAQFA